MNALDRDWFGEPAPAPPRWALWMHGGRSLHFRGGASLPPTLARPGAVFAEGLWEGDVAELFLLNPETGFYMEFNLSPDGAWWCCAFDAPRVRSGAASQEPWGAAAEAAEGMEPVCPGPLPGARGKSGKAAGRGAGWESTLTVPIGSLPRALAFDPDATRGNVAFCLGRPQRYFTLADLGGGEPDFHRPLGWVLLREMLGAAPGAL